MITVKPQDPSSAAGVVEFTVQWNTDNNPVLEIRLNPVEGWPEEVYIPEDPEMLAAVVRSILDPERFTTYNPRTRMALIMAILPWAWRSEMILPPQVDPLEDIS